MAEHTERCILNGLEMDSAVIEIEYRILPTGTNGSGITTRDPKVARAHADKGWHIQTRTVVRATSIWKDLPS